MTLHLIPKATNSLFISLCYFLEGSLPQQKNPRALCNEWELTQFYMFPCSPRKYFLFYKTTKRSEEIKREFVYTREGSRTLCVLLRFGNTLRLTPLSAPPLGRECTRNKNPPPKNKIGHTSPSFLLASPTTKARILCLDSL